MVKIIVRAVNVKGDKLAGEPSDEFIIEEDDERTAEMAARGLARLLSKVKEYDYTEVFEIVNGLEMRTKVYVRGFCVLSAG